MQRFVNDHTLVLYAFLCDILTLVPYQTPFTTGESPLKNLLRSLVPLLAVLFTLLLVGVALGAQNISQPSLEDKMVVWLLVVITLATGAHVIGGLIHKWTGLSEILGWLGLGITLHNLPWIKDLIHHLFLQPQYQLEHVVEVVAQLGVWLLLTEAGLETELPILVKNAGRGSLVALLGVIIPGTVVYLALPFIFPSLSPLGRALTAAIFTPTSLGVAAIFFKDARILSSGTAQLVMAVAAIDDVLGLLILTALAGMMVGAGASVSGILFILFKAITFFIASLTAGAILSPTLSRFMAKLNGGEAMRLKIALLSATIFAWLAHRWGLSPLMGAYAGGVFLTEVHFKEFESATEEHGVEYLLRGVKYVVVPIFVVSVAMKVDLSLFLAMRPITLLVVGLSGLVAGKLIASQLAGSQNDKRTLAWGALPRGEVALVIAGMGFSNHLIGADIMSVAVMAMVCSIIVTSLMLPRSITRARALNTHIFDPVGSASTKH